MTGLLELALLCEKATRSSRLLDFEIHIAAVEDAVWPIVDRFGHVTNPNSRMSDYLKIYRDVIDSDDQDFEFPRYTSTASAATALLPSHLYWMMAKGRNRPNEPLYAIQIIDPETRSTVAKSESDSLEGCICAAALRSRQSLVTGVV